MTNDAIFERLHREGYGITVNLWAEDEAYAVVLWRDGKPVGSGSSESMDEALERAEAMATVRA